MSNIIQSLWIGEELSVMEQLCLSSFVKNGHEVHLYTYEDVKNDFTLYSSILSDYGVISIHDTDNSFEKELIVTEDVKDKKHHAPFDGPNKLIKELKESKEWELFNFWNNGVMREKPSSTGLTLIQKCRT